MFSFYGTLKKKWVGRAMGNETIYWDGLNKKNELIVDGPACRSYLNFLRILRIIFIAKFSKYVFVIFIKLQ